MINYLKEYRSGPIVIFELTSEYAAILLTEGLNFYEIAEPFKNNFITIAKIDQHPTKQTQLFTYLVFHV